MARRRTDYKVEEMACTRGDEKDRRHPEKEKLGDFSKKKEEGGPETITDGGASPRKKARNWKRTKR